MRRPSLFVLPALLLAACATPRATVETSPVAPPEPEVVVEEPAPDPEPEPVAEVVPVPPRTVGEAIRLHEGCTSEQTAGTQRMACEGWDVVVELTEGDDTSTDLETETRATMQWFADRGARLVMLGEPECRVAGRDVDCSFVEARGDEGRMGTAYVAVSRPGDPGFVLKCLYLTPDRSRELEDPICSQVLEIGGVAVSSR